MGSSDNYPFSSDDWEAGTLDYLSQLAPSIRSIAILQSTPSLDYDPLACERAAIRRPRWLGASNCHMEFARNEKDPVWKALESAASRFPNVRIVDLNAEICLDGTCRSLDPAGRLVFRDRTHLDARFVETLAPLLSKKLSLER